MKNGKTYFINTYGCQMNVHESEKIAGILEDKGFSLSTSLESADIIVYNSCCVRETAETKIYGHLGKAKKLKETNPKLKVVLCGCMAQKPGETEKLKKRLPFVDLIIGTHNLDLLGDYLGLIEGKGRHFEVWESECDIEPTRAVATNGNDGFAESESVTSNDFSTNGDNAAAKSAIYNNESKYFEDGAVKQVTDDQLAKAYQAEGLPKISQEGAVSSANRSLNLPETQVAKTQMVQSRLPKSQLPTTESQLLKNGLPKTKPSKLPIKRKDKLSAFVTIMQGCNNFCTYCIVPYVRGRERSRDFDEIVTEVRALVGDGFKEITLLGQNVNSYGKDRGDGRDFAAILRALNDIDGKFKIKFMTSHPKDLSESVIKTIAEGKNLAKYIHLPVQAGSTRVLKAMNRTYTREQYLQLIRLVRSYMPDAGISSDLMVGFPTETDEEFLESLRLVEEVRFNNLYTFIYNRRSGTKADLLEGQIPESVKVERIEKIIKRQFELSAEAAQKCVGQTYEILCERFSNGKGYGKSWEDRPIYFTAKNSQITEFNSTMSDIGRDKNADFGEILSKTASGEEKDNPLEGRFITVKITSAKNTKLYGELITF